MNTSYFQNLILLLFLVFMGMACGDSSDSDGNAAMIKGRVENTSSSDTTDSTQAKLRPVEGASVTAARVQSDGRLSIVSDSATTTDAEGEFTLAVSADVVSNQSDRLIIMAENEGERAKAFVTPEVDAGATVLIQPITYESTAETEVYQQLVANGNAESDGSAESVHKADIEVFVNNEVAVDVESDSSLAANVAAGLTAKAATNTEFYNRLGVEISGEQRNETEQVKTDAQTELENRLYASAEEEGTIGAYEDFVETVAQAAVEAGVNATAAAKTSEVSSHVMLSQLSEISANAQAEVRQQAAIMLTFPLSEGVREQLEFAGASESTLNSADDAAVTLRTNIQTMSTPSEEEISAAFESYNQEIVSIIQNEFEINGELFAAANAEINESGGAKAALETTLEGLVAVPSVIDAYMQFFANAESVIDATFDNATEAELRTYFTQLLILINLSS